MARMHSRAKGKSGSTKPVKKTQPSWLRYKAREVEMLIAKLGKEGKTASQIGLILRDTYGVPDVKTVTKKSVTGILIDKKLTHEIPEDLRALIRKAVFIRKHLEENHKDEPAKRGLRLTESKIGRLVKYYKESGKLQMTWKYDPKKASMYLE